MRVSVLINAVDRVGHVFGTVEQIRRQRGCAPEIIIACAAATREHIVQRMRAVWGPSGVEVVTVGGDTPGARRNAAIAASSGDALLFLDAGDHISADYLATAVSHLDARPELAFVTAWMRQPGPDGLATLTKPTLSLVAFLGDRDPLPYPTVLRRSVWTALGGFDEHLVSCEWYDFSIRLLAADQNGAVIEWPHITYVAGRETAYRIDLESDRYLAGKRAVVEKHDTLFRRHVVDALCNRESSMRQQAIHYHRLIQRRDHLLSERDALSTRLDATMAQLRELNGEGVDWGDLRRVLPLSADWGYERGTPIDRYYIERFLRSCAADVRGAVLEIQESDYSKRFGGDRVTRSDVIDIDVHNERANLTGDLRRLEAIPSDTYDCFILTQTVHVIDDMRAVLREAVRIVKPGGVLLVTFPYTSRVCLEYGPDGDFWRVTEAGARTLFTELLPATHLDIQAYGNVLTNTAFLEGIACEEISAEEFEWYEPFNPMLVSVRAVKPMPDAPMPRRRTVTGQASILLYHRVAGPPLDIHGLSVRPEHFHAQMQHIAREYHPMSLPQLAMAVREGWLPERAVAVTFDDGYIDNLRMASPILTDLGIPATFFITDASLTGGLEYWWDALASLFFGTAQLPPRLTVDSGHDIIDLATGSPQEREQAHWVLYHRLRQALAPDRDRLLAQLKAWAGISDIDPAARPMNRSELEDLARRPGHSIGGHGCDHISYSAHAPDVIRRDIRDNRFQLEVAIGRIATSFAYPYGDHTDVSVEIAEEVGYRAAVTCVEAIVRPGTDPLRLPRYSVGPGDAAGFADRLRAIFAAAAPSA